MMDVRERDRDMARKYLDYATRTNPFIAFFDGCCEPRNPGGTAGYGALVMEKGARVWDHSGFVPPSPTTSNNIAEYLAVSSVLDYFLQRGDHFVKAAIFGDSRLVICQLWGWPIGARKWRIKGIDTASDAKGHYADIAHEARVKLKKLPNVKGYWIPREENSEADDLSKSHLRNRGVQFRIQPE